MGFFKTKLKEKKGAASVLVILIMVVFCVLGLLSMVYAYSNYRLSQKTYAWQEEYYALDMLGEESLQGINNLLYICSSQAENELDFYLLASETLNNWLKEQNPSTYNTWQFQAQLNTSANQQPFAFALQGANNTLQVALLPQYIPKNKGEYYIILSWSLIQPGFDYDQDQFAEWQLLEE